MKRGLHLIADLKNCKNLEVLSSKKDIENFLFEITKLIKMKAISKPKVIYYKHKIKKESGVTGFLIISDSHVSVHTYPFKKSLYFDLFSCRDFNHRKVIKMLNEVFKPEKIKKKILRR